MEVHGIMRESSAGGKTAVFHADESVRDAYVTRFIILSRGSMKEVCGAGIDSRGGDGLEERGFYH